VDNVHVFQGHVAKKEENKKSKNKKEVHQQVLLGLSTNAM
jgi:hypothetical protein